MDCSPGRPWPHWAQARQEGQQSWMIAPPWRGMMLIALMASPSPPPRLWWRNFGVISPRGVGVDPIVAALGPQRGLIHVQGGRVTGKNDVAGQPLERFEQGDMVLRPVVGAAAPIRCAGPAQVWWVAADQFTARKRILGQKPMGAIKPGKAPGMEVDADVVQRRRLALHDRTTAQVGFDRGVVRRHQGDDRLAQAGGRLRSKITAHVSGSMLICWRPAVALMSYAVKQLLLTCGRYELDEGRKG